MLRVYDKFETVFDNNGLCVLENATDVKVHKEINGEWELSFKLPIFDAKRKYIIGDNIVFAEGQGYRINHIDYDAVSAVPLYKDAAEHHLPRTGDFINHTPYNIMNILFDGTAIHVMTQAEVSALGMEWVAEKTDLFDQSRVTPLGGLTALMEQLDKYHIHNELYFDNYNIALVRQRGKDCGYKIDLHLNSDEIKASIDTSEIITRLFPYGKNGLEITNAVSGNGKAYIESPYCSNGSARIKEGFINFDEIEDPDELLEAAKRQFDEDNPERIDNPKYSVSTKCFQQNNEVDIGDIVEVNDIQNGIVSKQRVISEECYLFEPNRTEINVGTPTLTLQDVITRADYQYVKNKLNTNERGEIKTSVLEMMQKNESVSINEALQNEDIALYKTGSLYESDSGAIAIIKGRLAVANKRDDSGQWKWTSIMDGGKVIVNEVFTGNLFTSDVRILGESDGQEKLVIHENLIEIKDENRTRIKIGFDGSKYVFSMFNTKGVETLYLNQNGNAEFAGNINTAEDVTVGNTINLQLDNNMSFGQIYAGDSKIHSGEKTFQILGQNVDVYAQGSVLRLRGQQKVSIGTNRSGNNVYVNDELVATESDINNLKNMINNIQNQVNSLKGSGE